MIFLELESYIDPPLGFPGHPYFTSDLWPLILRRSDEVRTVLWFQHEPPVNQAGVRESYLTDLGPLTNQSDQTMELLKHRSYYGGDLNVLYVVQPDSSLLMELVKMFPIPGVMASDLTTDLGLSVAARSELARFVENHLLPCWAVLAFAHEGDTAYIFGQRETLETLLAASADNKPRSDI